MKPSAWIPVLFAVALLPAGGARYSGCPLCRMRAKADGLGLRRPEKVSSSERQFPQFSHCRVGLRKRWHFRRFFGAGVHADSLSSSRKG